MGSGRSRTSTEGRKMELAPAYEFLEKYPDADVVMIMNNHSSQDGLVLLDQFQQDGEKFCTTFENVSCPP
jgi:hypothetical protein